MNTLWIVLGTAVLAGISVQISKVECLNILGVFPVPAKSHFFVFEPYLKELAKRGHNVTVISFYPTKEPLANYTDINLAENTGQFQPSFPISDSILITFFTLTLIHAFGGPVVCKLLMDDENVQNLIVSDAKFDLVIVEQFNNDCGLAIAHKFGAPIVGITSHMLLPWHYQRFGVPYNPSYVLFDLMTPGTRPNLLQRIQRTFMYNYLNFIYKYITQRLEQNVISDYMDDVPALEEIARNIRVVLVYQNFVLTGSTVLPANVIEVSGFHVSKPKPLPADLKKFIEESEHGVIYVSFGSILKPSSMPKDKMIAIIEALKELKQRVIWKWNKKDFPGNPKNILVTKWLPQSDVLAHPNVVAFFSHCGQLGVTEAIYHGVPVIGMPIFGDQPSNAAAVEESGLGVQIRLSEITKELMLEKFKAVLNPSFRENVKLISKAWHDRPLKAMDTAIFWTEFAARHNITYGTPVVSVSTYQYYNLDIITLLLLLSIVTLVVIKYAVVLVKKKVFDYFNKSDKSLLKRKNDNKKQ